MLLLIVNGKSQGNSQVNTVQKVGDFGIFSYKCDVVINQGSGNYAEEVEESL